MDWILNHIWIVVVISGLVVRVLQAARGKQPPAGKDAAPPRRQEYVDAELAERTRKIREEIRRKIEERRGQTGAPAASAAQSRPAAATRAAAAPPPAAVTELPPVVRKVTVTAAPATVEEPAVNAGELARQAALADQLRLVVAKKVGADRRAAFAASFADREQAALVIGRGALLDDLREPDALRRAFVLREVLGPPVALRN
jgi:hypothetical protein